MMFKGDHREIGREHDSWVEINKGRATVNQVKMAQDQQTANFCKHREMIQFHKNTEFINQNNKYND